MAVSGSRPGRMTEIQQSKLWREKQREISPERTKVWTEPLDGKLKIDHRVPVVYYLSRNGHLEHPHFMEIHLSSPQGLFLRDVICRLNILRRKDMAAMYSWSCKRSYKNGFVWHDLSENDFIYPVHGHEYILKGSELPGNTFFETTTSSQRQHLRSLPPRETQITAADVNYHRQSRRRNQSCSSIDFNLQEYSVYMAESSSRSSADASTQTGDNRRRRPPLEIVEEKSKELHRDEIEISPPPSDSSPETLEKQMKAEGLLVLLPEAVNKESTSKRHRIQRGSKSSVLRQLFSCGSISFMDCGPGQEAAGLIPQGTMRMPRGGRMKLEEDEYISGSIVETKKEKFSKLKRCSSYQCCHTRSY